MAGIRHNAASEADSDTREMSWSLKVGIWLASKPEKLSKMADKEMWTLANWLIDENINKNKEMAVKNEQKKQEKSTIQRR